MNVVVRTESSPTIGVGHVMRCLTLAESLRNRGASVSFICREYEGARFDLIERNNFAVVRLPGPGREATGPAAHPAWRGPSWQQDAEETRHAIESLRARPNWLVVDHYAIDERVERELRASVDRIMVIDDLADRPHDCDALLDQNLVAEMHERYRGKVPARCSNLLGPRYALLQPVYAELHDRTPARSGPIRRIFVFFSGADVDNLTGLAIAAFLRLERADVCLDVVITAAHPCADAIRKQVAGRANIRLFSDLPTLAALMASADLAIGAGGATSWERACLGLPGLVVTMADNQRAIAAGLSAHGLIRLIGHKDEISEDSFFRVLGELLAQELDGSWSRRCSSTVDGRGTARVCDLLTVSSATRLRARRASASDEGLLLEWANDPVTRGNAFSSQMISAESHGDWFRSRLQRPDSSRIYVIQTDEDEIAIGQARFERVNEEWEIDYALAPQFRGLGLGRRLMEVALHALQEDEPGALLVGRVKEANRPSRRVFESLGFSIQSDERGVVYRRAL